MQNSSQVPDFILTAYVDVGMMKYMYFVLLLCLYVVTVGANVLLLLVICANRSLHEPMYLFLCSLFVNEVCGSTGLLPFLLLQTLSDSHTIPVVLCFLQIFCLYTYGGVEYLSLAVMSYDRYLAVCRPLCYRSIMSWRRMCVLVAMSWWWPLLLCVLMTSLSGPLQRCSSRIPKVYCDNYSVIKLACSSTSAYNVYGLFITSLSIFGPLCLIFYTYGKILRVCFSGHRETRQKAVSTCWPHLASLINFTCGGAFEILQSRFEMKQLPNLLRIFLSLYWLLCQPLFNPLLYGLSLSKIRIVSKSFYKIGQGVPA